MAITQKALMHRFLTQHTNKTYKVDNIECNKNPTSSLKGEHFEKRYKIPLHNMKKLLLALLHEAKNDKKGNQVNRVCTRT